MIYHWQNLGLHQLPHRPAQRPVQATACKQLRADGTAAGCEACHSRNRGKNSLASTTRRTSFPLLGAHRATACMDCHKPPNLETKLIDVDFTAAPTQCEDCHEDIHGKQFAKNEVTHCADCHNSTKWRPSLFDHDRRTDFPLRGAHQNVRCADCHKLTKSSPTRLSSSTSPRQRMRGLPRSGHASRIKTAAQT